MRIYSMTATFGKLENQTLELKPGLNLIHAPNEWGKSTWCAFLVTMLYGIDTSARSKKGVLADKERYAPWSGAPMSGRMEIHWNGRDITIERKAKGRTPMGQFSAYETATGLPVTELTATSCGEVILGVERSVFQRSGFIALSDLQVTQDEGLRRRLNALVTTGDESNASDALAQKLKELKNKCRYNRSGLLPQAEGQREALERDLQELSYLQNQCQSIQNRQKELEGLAVQLENHKQHLQYAAAQAGQQQVEAAEADWKRAEARAQQLEAECEALPTGEEAQRQLLSAQGLCEELQALHMQEQLLPGLPQPPQVPLRYRDFPPKAAVHEAQDDYGFWKMWGEYQQRHSRLAGVFALLSILGLVLLLIPVIRQSIGLFICLAVTVIGAALAIWYRHSAEGNRQNRENIARRHPGRSPEEWVTEAEGFCQAWEAYEAQCAQIRTRQDANAQSRQRTEKSIAALCQGTGLQEYMAQCRACMATHQAFAEAQREQLRAKEHMEALQRVAKPVPMPSQPDEMTCSEAETRGLISDTAFELRQLSTRLGQCQGKMEALGSREKLEAQLEAVNTRIRRLRDTYHALELALKALGEASDALQRRFAPRISRQAQDIFSRLTDGKYSRVTLQQDLSIQAGASEEPVLRPALWRSEGTIDQLYLALRLAVSRELTPAAPLILDDAFARFDDGRLKNAMDILKEEAQSRQIILFTCQSREEALA